MNVETRYGPSYTLAMISLSSGETVQAESGAMVSMDDGIGMETSTKCGLFKGMKRAVLGGESLFINTFTAQRDAQITMAPAFPGDVKLMQLQNQTMFVQSGSYMASSGDIEIDTKWGGGKTFFSREGLFLLKCTGTGTIFLSSYGAIHLIELAAGQKHSVDTGHMVAFDETVTYDVGRAGGWKTTLLGGEGMVCKLTGPGRFYMQTRSPDSFLAWLTPKLPGKRE